MEILLGLLLGTVLIGSAVAMGGGSDTEPDTDPEPDTPTEGADMLDIAPDATGSVDALAGADTISVNAETGGAFDDVTPLQLAWNTDDTEPPLTVTGGAGDDTLTLSGSGYAATGGAGADRIDVGDANSVAVTAGAGDTVTGGTGRGVNVLLTETAVYNGSASAEAVVNQSSGPVSMGAGNDTVLGVDGGASSVAGGDGDDVLVGSISEAAFLPSATDLLSYRASTDADTLDGGAGNDRIALSHGDLVTTGAGADSLALYLGENPAAEAATITDFDPALDRLVISYGSFAIAPEPLVGEITVTETPAGDTVITGSDGQVLARLVGVTGVSVGLQPSETSPLTNLAGTPTPGTTYDVTIARYFNATS